MSKLITHKEANWYGFVAIITFVAAILLPLELTLFKEKITWHRPIELLISGVFFLDVLINYSLHVKLKRHHMGTDFPWVRKQFRLWQINDLLAAIPMIWLSSIPLLQLNRVLKFPKMFGIISMIHNRHPRYGKALNLSFLFIGIGILTHWVSCGWIAITGQSANPDIYTTYLKACYWAITTLSTVGYGDILPSNNAQILYSIFVQILGVGTFGFMVGNIVHLFTKLDPARAQYKEHMEQLSALVSYRNLPRHLHRRIADFYTFNWQKRLGYDESSFLKELPHSLRVDVALFLKKEVLEQVPFFKQAPDQLIREAALHLKPLFLTPGDYLFKAGEEGHEMFFVVKGKLNVYLKKETKHIQELKAGDFFGEISLLENVERTASVQAKTFCDLYRLDRPSFERMTCKNPEMMEVFKVAAESRQRDLLPIKNL